MPEPGTLTDTDRRVLGYLRESGADYPALVAGNTGAHIPLVERRISVLVDRGLVEAVSGETVYRITAAGEAAIDCPESDPQAGRSTLGLE
ncbi:DUF2250 domain-containing protein [Halorarum salinum]|uniref:DUF2250 domain-containing protein n=1 Tax=Halorarum salinum TaxID=2743089 RepID=A0A7D5Q8Z9_9EURY|nr:DUF2250 domain-containing protein [Halobaculum salinum]QLG61317.1 DUF2250 domain-containing protein [Halobaculum salinum]